MSTSKQVYSENRINSVRKFNKVLLKVLNRIFKIFVKCFDKVDLNIFHILQNMEFIALHVQDVLKNKQKFILSNRTPQKFLFIFSGPSCFSLTKVYIDLFTCAPVLS